MVNETISTEEGEVLRFIQICEDGKRELTDWEYRFYESICRQYNQRTAFYFSESQMRSIRRIITKLEDIR